MDRFRNFLRKSFRKITTLDTGAGGQKTPSTERSFVSESSSADSSDSSAAESAVGQQNRQRYRQLMPPSTSASTEADSSEDILSRSVEVTPEREDRHDEIGEASSSCNSSCFSIGMDILSRNVDAKLPARSTVVYIFDGTSAVGKTTFLRNATKERGLIARMLHNDFTEVTSRYPIFTRKHDDPTLDSCYPYLLLGRFIKAVNETQECGDEKSRDFRVLLSDRCFFSNMVYRAIYDYGGDRSFNLMRERLHADDGAILRTLEETWKTIDQLIAMQDLGRCRVERMFICVDNENPRLLARRFLARQGIEVCVHNNADVRTEDAYRQIVEFVKSQNYLFTRMAASMPLTTMLLDLHGKTLSQFNYDCGGVLNMSADLERIRSPSGDSVSPKSPPTVASSKGKNLLSLEKSRRRWSNVNFRRRIVMTNV